MSSSPCSETANQVFPLGFQVPSCAWFSSQCEHLGFTSVSSALGFCCSTMLPLSFQLYADMHWCPTLPLPKNMCSPIKTHFLWVHAYTCSPFWLCSQQQLTGLFALKLAGSPGLHDVSSRGHGLWLLFSLLCYSFAEWRLLWSCESLCLGKDVPSCARTLGLSLACSFLPSLLVQDVPIHVSEQWKWDFLMETEAGGKNSQMRIPWVS